MNAIIDWNRAIYVDSVLDDSLQKRLIPQILRLQAQSTAPITVAIDSPGGSLSVLNALLGVLQSENQNGFRNSIITVVVGNASSAAAKFLAFGDHAISYPHSRILYHDVRFNGMDDVTSSVASQTANELESYSYNDSLKLADKLIDRLFWVYIDLQSEFEETRKNLPKLAAEGDEVLFNYLGHKPRTRIDVVGFALTLYLKLSRGPDKKVALSALTKLQTFLHLEQIDEAANLLVSETGESSNLLFGLDLLMKKLNEEESKFNFAKFYKGVNSKVELSEKVKKDIQLVVEVILRRAFIDANWSLGQEGFDLIKQDFQFVKNMRDPKHVRTIFNLASDYAYMFFEKDTVAKMRAASSRDEKFDVAYPFYKEIQVMWFYTILICQNLAQGENYLTPFDAQLLGIVHEVLGASGIESLREFRARRDKQKIDDQFDSISYYA